MPAEEPSARVRLAELVAALSLGIDLGFGQPMEHILRQCLIALRLAERVGLDEQARAVVYYTALLINGVSGASISRSGRILAAADVYRALREPRPHRAARPADEAARVLREEARAGRALTPRAQGVRPRVSRGSERRSCRQPRPTPSDRWRYGNHPGSKKSPRSFSP